MPRKGEILPRAPVGRIMTNVGAERVSAAAINELADILTKEGEEISEKAIKIAHHSGRKTVKGEDIRLANEY